MKIIVAAATLALMAPKADATCTFSRILGDNDIDVSDTVEGFDVASGANTNCVLRAESGTNCQLTLKYGEEPTQFFNDGSGDSDNCQDFTVTISSNDRESILGYRVQATNANNVAIGCTCTETVGDTGGSGVGFICFSGDSTVQVEGRGEISMDSLQVGDNVLSDNGKYEPVYSFGHLNKEKEAVFYQIRTNHEMDSKPLEITGNHMVFKVNDNGEQEAVRADSLALYDKLVSAHGEVKEVTFIKTVEKKGLYMPLTPGGSIIVSGLKASAYTSIDGEAPGVVSDASSYFISEQTLTHWWLAPFRMMCMGVSSHFCGNSPDQRNEDGILNYLMAGHKFATFAEQFGSIFRVTVMGPPVFLIFAFINAMEHAFWGPAMAPLAASLFAVALYYRNRMMANNAAPVKAKTV